MGHQVFISYTQPDRDEALAVHKNINDSGLISWIAPDSYHGIAAGQPFEDAIIRAIQSCRVFVLIYSMHCNNSRHVLREVKNAADDKVIIPFRLDHSDMNRELLYYLKGIQYIDATETHRQNARNKLIARLYELVGSGASRPERKGTSDNILFNEGVKLLKRSAYSDAQKKLQTYVEVSPEDREGRFYLALAIIAGRKTRKLDGRVVHVLENLLQPALGSPEHGHIGILLALIKQGYYRMNGLLDKPPTVEQLLEAHRRINLEKSRDILSLVPDPENEVWKKLDHFQRR